MDCIRSWAFKSAAYLATFLLVLIFVGPTLPLDLSILIVSGLLGAVGLSKDVRGWDVLRLSLANQRHRILQRFRR